MRCPRADTLALRRRIVSLLGQKNGTHFTCIHLERIFKLTIGLAIPASFKVYHQYQLRLQTLVNLDLKL